jgi:glucose-1-phosphate thymidylyltransferase
MLAGIQEILIVTTPHDSEDFKTLLGDGRSLGISISYETQARPEGIAQALLIAADFIAGDQVALILGDNIFYGPGLGRSLKELVVKNGATVFGVEVHDPERYGVIEISDQGDPISLEEKPQHPKSNLAVPGLYFFDASVAERTKGVRRSSRGEYEITSVISTYLSDGLLSVRKLNQGTIWMDCGTVKTMNEAINFVKSVEERNNTKIGCIEEVAWRQGWINTDQLKTLGSYYGLNEYGQYLVQLADNESNR